MLVNGTPYRTVWPHPEHDGVVQIIDQRQLPWSFEIEDLPEVEAVAVAIADMHVRGAGCIGATAGYGMWLAAREANRSEAQLRALADRLIETRPTASNLAWAVERQWRAITISDDWVGAARAEADAIADEDAEWCRRIGDHGLAIIEEIAAARSTPGPSTS